MSLKMIYTITLASLTLAAPARACMWDYDTLHEERSRFPSVLELIVGHFPQHSDAFYEWRIADREAAVADLDPDNPVTLPMRDDMAVAHDKLGRPERAIELMQRSLEIDPDRYETHANLGTFCIHSGEYEPGLEHIERAIEINPDAHFGREVVQKRLVEYVLSRQGADGSLPLPLRARVVERAEDGKFRVIPTAENGGRGDWRAPEWHEFEYGGFHAFLFRNDEGDPVQAELSEEEAMEGVAGMMRFGRGDSPILLEALGDLLASHGSNSSNSTGQRLAARAYLRASYLVNDPAAAEAYRELATNVLVMQQGASCRQIEAELKEELAAAEAYVATIAADEARWIAEGVDVEAAFNAEYRDAEAEAALPSSWGWEDVKPSYPLQVVLILAAILFVIVIAVIGAGWWLFRRLRRGWREAEAYGARVEGPSTVDPLIARASPIACRGDAL